MLKKQAHRILMPKIFVLNIIQRAYHSQIGVVNYDGIMNAFLCYVLPQLRHIMGHHGCLLSF